MPEQRSAFAPHGAKLGACSRRFRISIDRRKLIRQRKAALRQGKTQFERKRDTRPSADAGRRTQLTEKRKAQIDRRREALQQSQDKRKQIEEKRKERQKKLQQAAAEHKDKEKPRRLKPQGNLGD